MLTILLLSLLATPGPGAPGSLRCEYLENPMGVGPARPRLSWVLNDLSRGAVQSGYRVLVSSSRDKLGRDEADLWDSGTVTSRETIQVEYSGKELASAQRVFWKVRTLDGAGEASPWSEPATWTMGLLASSDWKAQWIGLPGGGTPAIAAHNGYHSQMAKDPDAGKWVVIDLGEKQAVDAVRLWPARPIDWTKDAPGFMFPVRFRIEISDDSSFAAPSVVVDKTAQDQPNPGTEARLYSFAPVQARYIRLIATRLAPRDPGEFGLALAEMEVLSKNRNLARGQQVTAQDSIEHNHWSTTRLTDGTTVSQRGATRSAARRPCSGQPRNSTPRPLAPRSLSPPAACTSSESTASEWATTSSPPNGRTTPAESSTRPTT
jgi:alpha-L-rhamnosidase